MSSRDPKEQENQKANKRQGGNLETKGASHANKRQGGNLETKGASHANKRQGGNLETKGASKVPPSGPAKKSNAPKRPSGQGRPSSR